MLRCTIHAQIIQTRKLSEKIQRKLSTGKIHFAEQKTELLLYASKHFSWYHVELSSVFRLINIYKGFEWLIFIVLQLFTYKPEKVESGAWKKTAETALCKVGVFRNCTKFTGKNFRSSHRRCSVKKVLGNLNQNLWKESILGHERGKFL